MSESSLQVAFINWARVALPECIVYHSYQENAVNAIQGKIKKDRGVLAGVMDNTILAPGPQVFFIELKDPNKPKSTNKYSDSQKGFAERLDKLGCKHACCQNGEQIEAAVRSFGLNPKVRFPGVLASSKKVMFMQELMDVWKKD